MSAFNMIGMNFKRPKEKFFPPIKLLSMDLFDLVLPEIVVIWRAVLKRNGPLPFLSQQHSTFRKKAMKNTFSCKTSKPNNLSCWKEELISFVKD